MTLSAGPDPLYGPLSQLKLLAYIVCLLQIFLSFFLTDCGDGLEVNKVDLRNAGILKVPVNDDFTHCVLEPFGLMIFFCEEGCVYREGFFKFKSGTRPFELPFQPSGANEYANPYENTRSSHPFMMAG